MDTNIALENLLLARDVLNAINVRYFLADGTLLGSVRDRRFIDGDNDIDIGVFAEDFDVISFGLYASLMRRKGFERQLMGIWNKYFVVQWMRRNVMVDVAFYFRRGDRRIAHVFDKGRILELSYPAEIIETLSPVDFYGNTFMAPKNEAAVLSYQYGDWTVRRSDWDWRTSPLNLSPWKSTTKLDSLYSSLSIGILRLSDKVMGRFIIPQS